MDKKRVCDPWARLGFCERRRSFMKKNCPQRCNLCSGETLKTSPAALAFTSTLYSSCCMWTVHYFKLQTNTADSLTCFAPQSLWMQCLLRHLLPKMWRSKSCLVEKLWASAVGQKTPECLQKSGRAALTHEAWCIICDTRISKFFHVLTWSKRDEKTVVLHCHLIEFKVEKTCLFVVKSLMIFVKQTYK